MSDSRIEDFKLLGFLQGQGLVTSAQGRRVERLLAAGRSLEEALHSTPIVDPLQLHRARQALDAGVSMSSAEVPRLAPAPPSPPQPPKPAIDIDEAREEIDHVIEDTERVLTEEFVRKLAARAEPPPATLPPVDGVRRDRDGVAVLDFGPLIDEDPPVPIEPLGIEREPGHEPKEFGRNVWKRKDEEELDPDGFRGLSQESVTVYRRIPGLLQEIDELPIYDLNHDEGIPLVRLINEIIVNALANNAGALQIALGDHHAARAEYDLEGQRMTELAEDAKLIRRMLPRLKLMARLSPWKEDDASGMFRVRRKKVEHGVKLVLTKENAAQRATLIIQQEMLN